MRRARSLGLAHRYSTQLPTRTLIRCFMALPLLPAEHIARKCSDLCLSVRDDDEILKKMIVYMKRQWIESSSHSLSSLSVYGMNIRTNNDTEAYHCGLNKRVGECHINMYKLIERLHEDAVSARLTCGLVNLQKINRQQKSNFKINNSRLINLFGRYNTGNMSATDLLIAGSYLLNPQDNIDILSDNEEDDV